MRKINLLAAAAAFVCWGSAAHAVLFSNFTATSGASGVGLSGCDVLSPTGDIGVSCSDLVLAQVALTAVGSPLLPSPELTTTLTTVSSLSELGVAGGLLCEVIQFGIASYTGPVEVTMTVNNIDPEESFSLLLLAEIGTLRFAHTFDASGTATSGPIDPSGVTADGVFYNLLIPNGGYVIATVEITRVATPEPVSLALLGSGLLGLGIVRIRRRRDEV